MNIEYFISKRLIFSKDKNNLFSKPITRITVSAVALSIAVMLISFSVLFGFKNEITNKIIAFNSHIQIKFNKSVTDNNSRIDLSKSLSDKIVAIPEVKNIYGVINDFGLIKTSNDFLGVNIKALDFSDESYSVHFNEYIIEGEISSNDKGILLSETTLNRLNLKVGDKINMYFPSMYNNQRSIPADNFYISGVYKTAMADFDDKVVFVNAQQIRNFYNRRNKTIEGDSLFWNKNDFGLIEVSLHKFSEIEFVENSIYDVLNEYYLYNNQDLVAFHEIDIVNVKDIYPDIFYWLKSLDSNVLLISIIMLIVAAVNLVSSTLITIIEKTSFIGVLKSMGFVNFSIYKIFLLNSLYVAMKGIFFGNLIAFILLFIQYKYEIIPLNEKDYYMETIPISFDLSSIIFINLGALIVCFIIIILPAILISKISPIKSIRFN